MAAVKPRRCALPTCALLAAIALAGACGDEATAPARLDPPDVALGKRLFRETRFAQHFAAHAGGDMNRRLAEGDPTVASVDTPGGPVAGPYRGSSVNCASCHLSDELRSQGNAGARAFVDFAARSPIPVREDGLSSTTRNTTSLVDVQMDGAPLLLHADGEFGSVAELVAASFVGRNFGWLPEERAQAVVHLAKVIREDDGTGPLARELGGLPYRVALAGADAAIPSERRLPEVLRLDVEASSDDQICSPWPRWWGGTSARSRWPGTSKGSIAARPMITSSGKTACPPGPTPAKPPATTDSGSTRCWPTSRARPSSMRRTGALPATTSASPSDRSSSAACRLSSASRASRPAVLPESGPVPAAILRRTLPTSGFTTRASASSSTTASTAPGPSPRWRSRPCRSGGRTILGRRGRFRDVPARDRPGHADLGVWNILGNQAASSVQPALQQTLCPMIVNGPGPCALEDLLPLTIGSFKTRGLRNLGLSGPYFHNGRAARLEDTITHYMVATLVLANGELRSGDLALEWLRTKSADVAPLAAFLRSLNED